MFSVRIFVYIALAFALCLGDASPAEATMERYCGIAPYDTEAAAVPPLSDKRVAESTSSTSTSNMTLQHVTVVGRHGDRVYLFPHQCWDGPIHTWNCTLGFLDASSHNLTNEVSNTGRLFRVKPIDGREYLPGNCLLGQLTSQGYEQWETNGAAFREAYVGDGKLLPTKLNAADIYLRSDNEERTMQSTFAMMNGLYPPGNASAAGIEVVDLHLMDENTDNLSPNSAICPSYSTYTSEWLYSPAGEEISTNYTTPATNAIAKALNMSFSDVVLGRIHDCYFTHVCHGFAIPGNVDQATWQLVINQQLAYYRSQYGYPNRQEFGQVAMGPFIKELKERWQGALNGTSTYKFEQFTTHDLSVMPFLYALGIMNNQWTPYAGNVVFEIWMDESANYYVRTILYGEEVLVPNCPAVLCPIDTFFTDVMDPVIPDNSQCTGI